MCGSRTYVCVDTTENEHIISVSGLKGKSALMIFDKHPEYRNKNGRHFWARGYYVETIGQVNEETIKNYIKEQEDSDRIEG